MKLKNTLSLCASVLCLSLFFCVSMSAQNSKAQTGVLTTADFNRRLIPMYRRHSEI